MKNIYALHIKAFAFFCLFTIFSLSVSAQVGIGTSNPNGGSILDVESTNKGVLIPRVNIANLNTLAPVTGGQAEGMLVYNTNSTTGPGFFYWNSNTTTGSWIAVSGSGGSDVELVFEDSTFLDSPVYIDGLNGAASVGLLYTHQITLTKTTLVEVKVTISVEITRYNVASVVGGKPILYGMILTAGDLSTGIPVISDIKSFTSYGNANSVGGAVIGGYYTLQGTGYVNLPAGVHDLNLYVVGMGGGNQGYTLFFSNDNDARFQIIYHN